MVSDLEGGDFDLLDEQLIQLRQDNFTLIRVAEQMTDLVLEIFHEVEEGTDLKPMIPIATLIASHAQVALFDALKRTIE